MTTALRYGQHPSRLNLTIASTIHAPKPRPKTPSTCPLQHHHPQFSPMSSHSSAPPLKRRKTEQDTPHTSVRLTAPYKHLPDSSHSSSAPKPRFKLYIWRCSNLKCNTTNETLGREQGYSDKNWVRGPCWVGEGCEVCGKEVGKGAVLLEVKLVEEGTGGGYGDRGSRL
jgi:hypothetical protein